jgi:hypothetical protein
MISHFIKGNGFMMQLKARESFSTLMEVYISDNGRITKQKEEGCSLRMMDTNGLGNGSKMYYLELVWKLSNF